MPAVVFQDDMILHHNFLVCKNVSDLFRTIERAIFADISQRVAYWPTTLNSVEGLY